MQRAFELELKAIAADGTFEGLAATYGNVDSVGDRIMPGAFTRTLATSKERPLLLSHRASVGVVSLTDSPAGLFAKGRLSLGARDAQDAYALLKDGALKAMSIGFETVKANWVGDVRELSEIKLWEVSLVATPANEMALISGVKNHNFNYGRVSLALKSFGTDILRELKVRN